MKVRFILCLVMLSTFSASSIGCADENKWFASFSITLNNNTKGLDALLEKSENKTKGYLHDYPNLQPKKNTAHPGDQNVLSFFNLGVCNSPNNPADASGYYTVKVVDEHHHSTEICKIKYNLSNLGITSCETTNVQGTVKCNIHCDGNTRITINDT